MRWRSILGLLALIVAIFFAVELVRTVVQVDQAERRLHAVIATARVIEVFYQSTGSLPQSWDDLQSIDLTVKTSSMYQWPKDVEELRRQVRVDFGRSPEQIRANGIDGYLSTDQPAYDYAVRLERLADSIKAGTAPSIPPEN